MALIVSALLGAWLAPAAPSAPAATKAPTATLRIYLARHGETDWNAAHRIQGSTDTHLNALGREQAAALAKQLAGVHFDAVYSSRLARSRETADIVRGKNTVTGLAELNERAAGRFQGFRTDSDSVATAEYNRRKGTSGDDLDGGETLETLLARVSTALTAIERRYPGGSVLVVGHGGTNQAILKALLGLTWDQALGVSQANDELYLVETGPGGPPRLWKLIGEKNLKDL